MAKPKVERVKADKAEAAHKQVEAETGRTVVGASTILEFCQRHRISVAFFYELKKAGKAPRVTNLGTRRIISDEDAAVWRKVMAEASEEQAATTS